MQCEKAVNGWPGACHKSFVTEDQANTWLINYHSSTCTLRGMFQISSHYNLADVAVDTGNPWLTTPDPQTSAIGQTTPRPDTPPTVPLDVEPFTEDFISLPSSSEEDSLSWKSTVTLSDEQNYILSLARQGKNIFFTGSAGAYPDSHPTKMVDFIFNKGLGSQSF